MDCETLIVGTGPTALAAAMALRRAGVPFEVLDTAFDLDSETASRVTTLAAADPVDWDPSDVTALFPAPRTSSKGVEKRLYFGSDAPYRRPGPLHIEERQCVIDVSHGFAGFGTVWGGAILPYHDTDLSGWPLGAGDFAPSHQNLSAYLRTSGEADALADRFPMPPGATPLPRSGQADFLLDACDARRDALESAGIFHGRARLAIDSGGGPATCQFCARCLDGCAYGALFNPRHQWKLLETEGVKIHRGQYAFEFEDHHDTATLHSIDLATNTPRTWTTKRLFLATGAINSTRIVARSLGLFDRPIRLLDSQYFFFPFLSYRSVEFPRANVTLAEAFMEILNPALGGNYLHFQVYGLNELFRQTLRSMAPALLRSVLPFGALDSRFFLFQGFLPSGQSGHLEMQLQNGGERDDRVSIAGIPHPESRSIALKARRLLGKHLRGIGFTPPAGLTMVPLGRSFHVGGSFPMGGQDPTFSSDLLGRPAGLQHVHLLDASTFPSIPATTITYTAMANADRIATAVASER